MTNGRQTVSLLDHDPELGSGLRGVAREIARRELIADLIERPRGPLEVGSSIESEPGALGLLVLDGLIGRRVSLFSRRAMELLGAGDLLRPWQDDAEHSVAPFDAVNQVLEPVRLALLDRRATVRIGRWPEVTATLVSRTLDRSRTVTGHLVLSQIPRVDERLHLLLWHLADRWGKVTPDGVVVTLRLSHEIFGALIGAQRPTVTLALRQLTDRGAIRRRADRTWLLLEQPPSEIEAKEDSEVLQADP